MDAAEIAVGISGLVFVLSLYQAWRQTRLMELTSKLQDKVNRLSVALDQSIKQLERVVEVSRQIYLLLYGDKPEQYLSFEKVGLVNSYKIELEALVTVIGDRSLLALAQEMIKQIDEAWNEARNISYGARDMADSGITAATYVNVFIRQGSQEKLSSAVLAVNIKAFEIMRREVQGKD